MDALEACACVKMNVRGGGRGTEWGVRDREDALPSDQKPAISFVTKAGSDTRQSRSPSPMMTAYHGAGIRKIP